MYSRGMTTSDISEQVKEVYGVDVSEGTVSNVTNKVIEHVKECKGNGGVSTLPCFISKKRH
jgi:transposase-like protein